MGRKYVSFTISSVGYCVPLDNVVQVVRKENVLETPGASTFVKGVISVRGDVIPVVDMHVRLGLSEARSQGKRRIVVIQFGKRSYGLLVDDVREILEVEGGEEPAGSPSLKPRLVRGTVQRGNASFYVLDLPEVFAIDMGSEARVEE